MVSEPRRENNILDIFLKNSPTLVVPGIADHSAVIGVVRLRPTIQIELYPELYTCALKQFVKV